MMDIQDELQENKNRILSTGQSDPSFEKEKLEVVYVFEIFYLKSLISVFPISLCLDCEWDVRSVLFSCLLSQTDSDSSLPHTCQPVRPVRPCQVPRSFV